MRLQSNALCLVLHLARTFIVFRLLQHSPSHLLVPPALASLNIIPDDCQLVASYSKSLNQTRFTFSVSWSNDNDVKSDDDKLILSIRAPVDESSEIINDSIASCKTGTDETILCDGPCGHRYPPEAIDVLGRCGHFLCKVCHGLVYNDDGTQGCSNFYCVYATLYSYLPEDYARRAYENHIMARQRAKELATNRTNVSPLPPSAGCYQGGTDRPQSTTNRKGATSSRSRTPRRGLTPTRRSSLTFVNRSKRGSKRSSPKNIFLPPNDDSRTPSFLRSSHSHSPPELHSRKMHVLDEIFSDVSAASSNQEGPTSEFELLNIRLMIFEPGPFKTIKRVHISREMSAALTVKEALDELMDRRTGTIRHECPSRLYFCTENSSNGLRRISVEEFESTRLWQYPARNSVLHFVLDAVGYLKGRGGD